MMENQVIEKYHKELFNHFGFNFGFAADMLEKYFDEPNSVTDYWRDYFDNLTKDWKFTHEQTVNTNGGSPNLGKQIGISDKYHISPSDEPKLISGVGAKMVV